MLCSIQQVFFSVLTSSSGYNLNNPIRQVARQRMTKCTRLLNHMLTFIVDVTNSIRKYQKSSRKVGKWTEPAGATHGEAIEINCLLVLWATDTQHTPSNYFQVWNEDCA